MVWDSTDLFKPGSDDCYPVLNGGDGVWVADSQDSFSHTCCFIQFGLFLFQFLHKLLNQKQQFQLGAGKSWKRNLNKFCIIWKALDQSKPEQIHQRKERRKINKKKKKKVLFLWEKLKNAQKAYSTQSIKWSFKIFTLSCHSTIL